MKIMFKQSDGNWGIVTPAPELYQPNSRTRQILAQANIFLESDNDILQHVLTKNSLLDKEYYLIEDDEVPSDRSYRAAWCYKEGMYTDLDKAKEIHLNNLRQERTEKLKKLDIQTMMAAGSGDSVKMAEVEGEKQALRDMPQTAVEDMKKITTVEELKSYKPEVMS